VFPLIKLAKKLKEENHPLVEKKEVQKWTGVFPLIKLAKKLKVHNPSNFKLVWGFLGSFH
jgi:hypothetical protein